MASGGRPFPFESVPRGVNVLRSERSQADIVVLCLEGTFDEAQAWRVRDALSQLAPETRVSLDFREVRAFHDFAIFLLARDLQTRQGRVQANGLCQHQRRLLKYLGVDEAGLGEPCAERAGLGAAGEDVADHLGF